MYTAACIEIVDAKPTLKNCENYTLDKSPIWE